MKNPMDKIPNVKFDKKNLRNPLTEDELERMRDNCDTLRKRALLEVFFSSGCRVSEIVKLNKDDIDWSSRSFRVLGKGNKTRTVYMSAKCELYLKKYLDNRTDNEIPLFITSKSPHARFGVRSVQREIHKLGVISNVKDRVSPHRIRHTTATIALRNGASITTVQELLGHESPVTTEIYTKLDNTIIKAEHKRVLSI